MSLVIAAHGCQLRPNLLEDTVFNKRLLALVPTATRRSIVAAILRLLSLGCQVAVLVWLADILMDVRASLSADIAVPSACIVLQFAFGACAEAAGRRAGAAAVTTLTKEVFEKLIGSGTTLPSRMSEGEASQLVSEGAQRLRPYFQDYLPQLVFALLAPLGLLVLLLTVSPLAGVLMLAFVVLMPASIMMLMGRAKRFMGAYWDDYVDLSSAFLDAIRGLVTLKGFRADASWQGRLARLAKEFRQATMRLLRVQMGNVLLMDLFTYGGIATGVVVATLQCAAGGISPSAALTVVFISSFFFLPMRRLGSLFHTGMNANAVCERIFALLDAEDQFATDEQVDLGGPGIECSNLSFSYDGKAKALDGVDFDVPAHTLIGVTGPSGSGKSTLIRAIAGGCVGYEGSIRVCGVELSRLSCESLFSVVSVVSQQSHVFKGSFRSNLLLGKEDAEDSELWGALRNAQLDAFVLSSGGLDAQVAEGGANLSGGQRQRLCFARALLRDTPIYVFDEVTSNIDASSERKLLDGISLLSVTHTVIMVTHRLSALALADEIYVMDEGRVAERGTHPALMARGGLYRRLWDRLADLETFAAQAGVEYDEDRYVPTDAELRVAKVVATHSIPLMGAQAMQAALEALSYRAYSSAPVAGLPKGHPAWIPLPDFGEPKAPADQVAVGTGGSDESEEDHRQDSGLSEEKDGNPSRRSRLKTILSMLRLTRGMGKEVLLAALLGTLGDLCVVAQLALAGWAVWVLAPASAGPGTMSCLVAICTLALVRAALHYGERLLTHDQTFRTLALVRDRVFGALRRLAPARLVARDAGDLVLLLTSDVESLEGLYSRTLAPTVSAILCSALTIASVGSCAWQLGLVALVGVVSLGIALPLVASSLTRRRAEKLNAYSVLMSSFVLDSLDGIFDLVQCGRARAYAKELETHAGSLEAGERPLGCAVALASALAGILVTLVSCAMTVAAVVLISRGAMSPGVGAACVLAVMADALIVADVSRLGFSLQRTLESANRIIDVMEEEPAVEEVSLDPGPHGSLVKGAVPVEVSGVSFSYGKREVLHGLSLRVRANALLRLTGPSGAGKSTLLRLIMRYWDVGAGSITVGGRDVRSIASDELRTSVCQMTQDSYLLDATLRENLLIARLRASDEELGRAIDASSLREVVDRLPQGLDTPVGMHGTALSDGERQRVGLCRALVSGAPLMLLDEPTSRLDSLNEAAVLSALRAAAEGRTIVLVSHRRVAAAIADETFVLQAKGR